MNNTGQAPLFHRAGIAMVESLLERVIAQDPVLQRDIAELAGGRLGIECLTPRLGVEIAPAGAGLLRLHPAISAQCSAVIRGPAHALLALARNPRTIASIEELQVEGDIGLAERLAVAIERSDLEIEDLIASFTGDRAAQPLGQLLRGGLGWLGRSTQSFRLDLEEYLQEEGRQLPTRSEMEGHAEAISALRMATDRVEARLQRLRELLMETGE